ncbi:MAG: FAD-binding protein, partial [Gemmataceae bacterium]|nr:FAD-binding protein [Gemmataceae bacterium]
GPAEFLVQPRTVDELNAVLKACQRDGVKVRMLGGGYNLLVRDDPVPGAVVRLTAPDFTRITHAGRKVVAGGGGQLFDLIAFTVSRGLAGLETLVGLRGTVGGSVRCNVGDKSGEIGQAVQRVSVLTEAGTVQTRTHDELNFAEHQSDLDEPVILTVEFELDAEKPEALLKRMRKAWVLRKGAEPFSFQAAVRLFRNPPGQAAAVLIDRAGMTKARVGGAELSERNTNYVVAHPGTTAADVMQLTELVKTRVRERTGVALERELHVW